VEIPHHCDLRVTDKRDLLWPTPWRRFLAMQSRVWKVRNLLDSTKAGMVTMHGSDGGGLVWIDRAWKATNRLDSSKARTVTVRGSDGGGSGGLIRINNES